MNITEMWPLQDTIRSYSELSKWQQWSNLWTLREKTWNGFASIESAKGVIKPKISLSTSYGQEVIRILLFRVIEEAAESLLSEDPLHIKEEMIDAINYLMSLFLIDDQKWDENFTVQLFTDLSEEVEWNTEFTISDLGSCALQLGGYLSDRLRNRAWMHNAQDFYFSGRDLMSSILAEVATYLLRPFENFEEFVAFFLAKDNVLQFRLKSHY